MVARMSTADQSGGTVLIAEDEPELADLYAGWLSDRYDVTAAYDGSAALEAIDEDIDVVLLDRRMPGLSGDQVLDDIRADELDCRVAMVTAVDPDFDIVELGFDDYLLKPVSREDIHEVVDQLLLRRTYDDQLQEFFSLATKKAYLDRQKTEGERKASREYASIEDRLAVLKVEVRDTLARLLEETDRAALCGDITRRALVEEL